MDILRGKTPDMVHKEIWAHILAYNFIRKVMAQAAMQHDKKPRQLSFKLALQTIASFRQANILNDKHLKLSVIAQIVMNQEELNVGVNPGIYCFTIQE